MKRNEREVYKGKISSYYLGLLTDDENKKVEKAFKYFNNPTMNFIIECKFKDNKSVRYIQINNAEKISTTSVQNYINFFLDQLRYEFK